jgi:hypothetical protein
MVGKMTLKVTPGTVSVGSVISEGAKDPLIFKPTVKLEVTGVPQPVSTETTITTEDGTSIPLPGFALYFGNSSADRVPLNGSTVTTGSFDLVPVVTDFASMRDAILSSVTGAGKLNILATIRIKPTMGEDIISLGVTLQINTITTPEAKNLKVRLGVSTDDKSATSSQPAKDVFQANAASTIVTRFNIFQAGGSPLDVTDALTGAVITLMHPTKAEERSVPGPVISAKTGTIGAVEQADIDAAAKPGAATGATPAIVAVEPLAGLVELSTLFNYAQLAGTMDLRAANPFVSAKDLETSFRYKIKLEGYNEFITPVVSVTAQYPASWISSLIQSIAGVETVADIAEHFNDTVCRLTFNLSAAAAPLTTTKPDAVKQAINKIVASSTYAIEGGGGLTAILGFGEFAGFTRVDKVTTAVVISLTPQQAVVEVPTLAGVSGRSPLGTGVSRVSSKRLVMTVPTGINPIPQFDTATN